MNNNIGNPELENYFENVKNFKSELSFLRSILLSCNLTEALKWKQPCYQLNNKNIIIIGEFKESCVLSFFKGALLHDADKLLSSPGENSQSAKWFKFTNITQIKKLHATIKAYIFEAIAIEQSGVKNDLSEKKELIFPNELIEAFKENPALKIAFNALTPGRQRAYNIFFTGAKQSKTITDRIEKYTKRILDGIGINDCTCGMSKRMPSCDGSHKYL